MTQDEPALACTLTEDEKAQRPEDIQRTLGEQYRTVVERDRGYTFVFEGAVGTFDALATFVANEQQCCAFAEYELTVSPASEETRLTITGPEGTKPQFEQLVDLLENGELPVS